MADADYSPGADPGPRADRRRTPGTDPTCHAGGSALVHGFATSPSVAADTMGWQLLYAVPWRMVSYASPNAWAEGVIRTSTSLAILGSRAYSLTSHRVTAT